MINIHLNNELLTVPDHYSLMALIKMKQLQINNFAIAINGSFIPKSLYETVGLNENDHIMLVSPMQGG